MAFKAKESEKSGETEEKEGGPAAAVAAKLNVMIPL